MPNVDLVAHREFFALYQGMKAYDAGQTDVECPYKEGTREYTLFIKGLQYGKDKHDRPRPVTRKTVAAYYKETQS
jgi:hypothetical protein